MPHIKEQLGILQDYYYFFLFFVFEESFTAAHGIGTRNLG
jgi:hypothetical protein